VGIAEFQQAQIKVKTLPRTPGPDQLLRLYALFKQATAGDCTGKRPGRLDFRGRAKYDSWSARKGMSKEDAMDGYVALVDELLAAAGMK